MRFLEKKEKIEILHSIIENKNTGTATNLADRLCVSLATVENYLALLREEGHQIGYCTGRKTYYLIEEKMQKYGGL
ncbi:MAG: helix-turn-helix domain-containing protein [Bacteroidales bacterium]|nr:helix-turn-helix domain-containing protein [Bacteroidales bacterium]